MDRQDLVFVTNTKSNKGGNAVSMGGSVTESQGNWHTVFSPNVRKTSHRENEMNQTPFFALAFVVASFFGFIYRNRVSEMVNTITGALLRDDKKRK